MATFILRVWLPDRPGVLGAVASRVGAVRGDVIGIDILERGGGRAVDELTVDLPGAELVDLLVGEVNEVDGVDVESVREATRAAVDPTATALDGVAALLAERDPEAMLGALVEAGERLVGATWAALVAVGEGTSVRLAVGDAPGDAWLEAFAAGSAHVDHGSTGSVDDVAAVPLRRSRSVLLVGRADPVLRDRERRRLTALAAIADRRWGELVDGVPAHPG